MRNLFIAAIALLLLAGCDFSSNGKAIANYANPKKAILVVDMQNDFISSTGRMPVMRSEVPALIEVANRAIGKNASEGNKVIYVRSVFPKTDIANLFRNNAAVEGSEGIEIYQGISIKSDYIFDKKKPDAFSNEDFEKFLIDNEVDELEILGVYADQCVFYTAKSALNRRYKVKYVENGVASASARAKENAIKRIRELGAIIMDE